ncbi:P-loop containing nucleoside triphosphate hydrolase [Sesbania bispinosa]|nr:P-loop containing nucleoside triphosphate hydrolase [Sesbania bispinosa]
MLIRPQYAEIEKIVEEVIRILDHNFSTPPTDVIGMHSPIEELEKVLLLDSVDDVRIVGICGMGGIGKTTLATALYDKISNQYDACCFIDNALVVLDNVDQVKDLQNLVANREWFGAGSRVIIICRDEHILKEYGVDAVFKVPLMNFDDAEQLFCRKAFKCDDIIRDYEEEENVEAIVLNDPYEEEKLMVEVLSKMSHLRLLILHEVKFSGSLNCLSNKLKYVDWHEYPFMYLPSSFQPNQLVELILKDSNIKQLWEGKKHLPSLRTMDLSHSKYLIKMPDLGDAPNLEWLNLEGCIKLVHIDRSIGLLEKLIFLNLKDCKNLASIPENILGLSNLEYLNLLGCSKVFNKQLLDKAENAEHLKKLDMSEATLHSQSTSSILKWIMFPFNFLYTRGYKDSATCLLPSLPNFSCLRELDISFCGLSQIPNAIGCILCLERLNLGGNNFVTLHCSFKELSKLVYLNLEHCKHLKSLPELPSRTCLPVGGEFLIGKKPPGSYIFNCPKLCERDCSSMSFSWMIQLLQVNNESPSSIDRINVVVPGNEIPKWFNIQSVGSSMRIDPSPIMEDNSWIGVACCAVFMALDDPTTWKNEWEPEPDIMIGFQNKGVGRYFGIPIILNRDLITVKSNHLWLIYFTRETFFDFVRNKDRILKKDVDDIKMEVLSNDAKGLRIEVKNWGYRWVYKQDLELLNQNGNSFARKRKFLEIENEAQAQS